VNKPHALSKTSAFLLSKSQRERRCIMIVPRRGELLNVLDSANLCITPITKASRCFDRVRYVSYPTYQMFLRSARGKSGALSLVLNQSIGPREPKHRTTRCAARDPSAEARAELTCDSNSDHLALMPLTVDLDIANQNFSERLGSAVLGSCLDVRCPDHLAPLFGFLGNGVAEVCG
jgi:hypothetical protein